MALELLFKLLKVLLIPYRWDRTVLKNISDWEKCWGFIRHAGFAHSAAFITLFNDVARRYSILTCACFKAAFCSHERVVCHIKARLLQSAYLVQIRQICSFPPLGQSDVGVGSRECASVVFCLPAYLLPPGPEFLILVNDSAHEAGAEEGGCGGGGGEYMGDKGQMQTISSSAV